MRTLIAILTAASLAAHVLLGCCWHHAHGCQKAACAAADCRGHDHGHHGHGAHRHPTDPVPGEEDGNRPAGATCNEVRCVFVGGAKPLVVADPATTGHLVWACVPPAGKLAVSVSLVRLDVGTQHNLPPPVRPHLAKQVLLI